MAPTVGLAITVMGNVAIAVPQLLVTVYETETGPAAIPVTTPEPDTVAVAVELLLQAPPIADTVRGIVAPEHTDAKPEITPALTAFTETIFLDIAVPQPVVTV